jgi:hypothetical protein
MSDETPDAPEMPNFDLNDLVFVLQVFDACAQRGAFRADEMLNLGMVYDRLKSFLISNGVIENPEETKE